MFGFIAGALAFGYVKASTLGAHRAPGSHAFEGFAGPELLEELQFRTGLERMALPKLGLSGETARIATSLAFGALHPGLELDAALGGYVYSKAYDKHGLLGAVATHVAHNLGVWLGAM